MTSWKYNLIDAYRVATTPYRAWRLAQWQRQGKVPVFAVFYHRIADSHPNPWTISCQEFERQVSWFEHHFQIVSLAEAQRRIACGFNDQPTLTITFDDGYAENCEFALPLLMERRIPVTYFVTFDQIKYQRPFQHDLDRGVPLPVNTLDSIRALGWAGIEIGSHTRTHTDVGRITDEDKLLDEVIVSSQELSDVIDQPIRYFAFPFGQRANLSKRAFQLLKSHGFEAACTTLGGWNEIGGDPFQITRLHADPSFSRVKNWLSFDPRLSNVEQFDYERELKIAATESAVASPLSIAPALPLVTSPVNGNFVTGNPQQV